MVSLYTASLLGIAITLASSRDTTSGPWASDIGRQLADQLRSDVPLTRSGAIQQTHHLAVYHCDLDLSDTVPALVHIYRTDSVARLRLAAVATLHALRDADGMKEVMSSLRDQTDRYVQIVSIAALRDFYGNNSFFSKDEVAELTQSILDGLDRPPDTVSRN